MGASRNEKNEKTGTLGPRPFVPVSEKLLLRLRAMGHFGILRHAAWPMANGMELEGMAVGVEGWHGGAKAKRCACERGAECELAIMLYISL